jgi:hypothetical protein
MLSFKRTFEILDAFGVKGELLEPSEEYKQFENYSARESFELEGKTNIELSIEMCDDFLSRFIVHGLQPATLTNNSSHDLMGQEEVDVLFEEMTLKVELT